jgi:hypothetical protein
VLQGQHLPRRPDATRQIKGRETGAGPEVEYPLASC